MLQDLSHCYTYTLLLYAKKKSKEQATLDTNYLQNVKFDLTFSLDQFLLDRILLIVSTTELQSLIT